MISTVIEALCVGIMCAVCYRIGVNRGAEEMKRCNSYVGVACINGLCPNALRNEDIDEYKDIYGTTRKQRCDYCGYNEGCTDCAMPEMQGLTVDESRFLEGRTDDENS